MPDVRKHSKRRRQNKTVLHGIVSVSCIYTRCEHNGVFPGEQTCKHRLEYCWLVGRREAGRFKDLITFPFNGLCMSRKRAMFRRCYKLNNTFEIPFRECVFHGSYLFF